MNRILSKLTRIGALFALASAFLYVAPAVIAQDDAAPAPEVEAIDENRAAYDALLEGQGEYAYAFDFFVTSMVWTIVSAALVFVMHLGFATLEAGLTRSKNTVNILFKNVFIISIGLLTYALLGFNTHYPGDFNGYLSFGSMIGDLNADGGGAFGYGGVALCMTGYGDFIFQAMFAATAATIVSGAVAERVHLLGFMIFATILVGIAYPVAGSWHWGGGWLAQLGGGDAAFKDFAGSSAVHAFGGFAALAAVLVLGPRKGKYVDGRIRPIPGHSMPLATIGVFLLWLGWFGFNGGSVLSADPGALGHVITTTCLAAAAGAIGAIGISWIVIKTPDLSMALNGVLAGLVGITAGADVVSVGSSIAIGLIGGVIVVFSILFFDKIRIDDPVGAISVHGVCGIYGTLATAIFQIPGSGVSFSSQLIGTLAFCVAAFVVAFVLASILKAIGLWRVSAEEEETGLDISEHGMEAYPDFGRTSAH
jgi:Amt family ammonium transporter